MSAPGFFGKVSSHGDFVARRLAPAAQGVWDAWLQAGLLASRDQLGARWLETYLGSPIWRFALAPGVLDDNAWAGVLMPSVDRVGRHFPLTIAAADAEGGVLDWVAGAGAWYERLEELALSSLAEGFSLEQFDAALLALEGPPGRCGAGAGPGGPSGWRLPLAGLDAVGAAAPLLAEAALRGQGLWWSDGSDAVEPSVLLCRGLPAPAAFAGLLAGNWRQTGWQA